MSLIGMYVLNTKYDEQKTRLALDILYGDRKNQFRELSLVLLNQKALHMMPHWKEYILNFCLDVEESFLTWSDQKPLLANSPQKSLMILRRLGQKKTSMNQIAHLLNISYDLSLEFKELYRRL
ncbi:hypothetical protein [Nitrosopumilus adriaticus]|uniref:Uncharacterized protein n=1 Tax=Nitrosopumilus adriaticus TaxID=1580092 RepID=A0A0D5C0R3_9ARCH|nr:hypothetical protein [Nitrosopumilus adriaticus]AJW70301.1 hypothetical protein NADRNF5_0605 [Nitrosopumilus adriaticus]